MLLILYALFLGTPLETVGGVMLQDVTTAHGRTYIRFYQDFFKFDVYVYDWKANQRAQTQTVTEFKKDGRIRTIAPGGVTASKTGILLSFAGLNELCHTDPDGNFLKTINLRPILDPKERINMVQPLDGDTILLATKKSGSMHLSEFNIQTLTHSPIYKTPKNGPFYLLKGDDAFLQIAHASGETDVLDGAFQSTYHLPALFESPQPQKTLSTILKSRDTQGLMNPIYGAGQLTMTYVVQRGKAKLKRSARFTGQTFLYSRYRPLAMSPDGSQLLLYDHEDEELRLRDKDFNLEESPIPPIP